MPLSSAEPLMKHLPIPSATVLRSRCRTRGKGALQPVFKFFGEGVCTSAVCQSRSSECHSGEGCVGLSGRALPTPPGPVVVMIRRSAVGDEDLVEVADLSGHGTWIDEVPHEIIHDLVEVWLPLHTMSRGHEE